MSKTFYRTGSDLEAVQAKAKHLADTFDDLESVIHMALIGALEDTAEAQNNHPKVGKKGYERATFKQEEQDGLYTYKGSIDTTLVAEYLYIAVAEKLRRNEWIDVPIKCGYEIQIHREGRRYRHRQVSCHTLAGSLLEFSWIDGPPPIFE